MKERKRKKELKNPKKVAPKSAEKKAKKVEDMTMQEIIETEVFAMELQKNLDAFERSRKEARKKANNPLKAHPIDKLIKDDEWNVKTMTELYVQCCYKECKRSANERVFIAMIGNFAYDRTKVILQENETKDTDADGQGQ